MSKLFISYTRQDLEKVLAFKHMIEGVTHQETWFDAKSVEANAEIGKCLIQAIESATQFLFVYSETSEKSQWQRRELEYAVQLNKEITVVCLATPSNDSWLNNFRQYPFVSPKSYIRQLKVASRPESKGSCDQVPWRTSCPETPYINPKRNHNKGCCGCLFLIVLLIGLVGLFWRSAPPSTPSESPEPTVRPYYPSSSSRPNGNVIPNIEPLPHEDEDLLGYHDQELQASPGDYDDACLTTENSSISDSDIVPIPGDPNAADNLSVSTWSIMLIAGCVMLLLLIIIGILGYMLFIKGKKKNTGKIVPVKPTDPPTVVPLFSKPRTIKIFIAGSTSLVAERDALRATISKMYNQYKQDNLVVEAYEYDDFPRDYVEGGQQKLYNDFIRNEANWVVFITNGTMGDKTLLELETAISAHKENGRPKILMYSIPEKASSDPLNSMNSFKELINKENNYWIDYSDINQIRSTFREHLDWDLINFMRDELRRSAS